MNQRKINSTYSNPASLRNLLMLALVFFVFPFQGCETSEFNKDAAARVGDKFLLTSEVKQMIPKGTKSNDSLQIARNYINAWVRKQTIIQHAEKNLPEDLTNFEKKMEDYRNSLLVYTYEKELVKQQLDTVVTDIEIQDYYENNLNNFELKENILLSDFVIFNPEIADKQLITQLLQSDSLSDRQQLEEYCKEIEADYFLDEEEWVFFNDLIKYIPIKTYNQENFLKNNNFVEVRDSLNVYLLRIKDFKIKESISPLDFEKENIRMIILNQRKTQLLERMESALFQEALKSNKIEIY